MSNLEALKARAKFYKAGAIIPRNILKCSKRKYQHLVKFGVDTWALPGVNGWVCIQHHTRGSAAIKLLKGGVGCLKFDGSPYHSGKSLWQGDLHMSEEEHYNKILEALGR
jgi:hypothetical protein